MSLTLLDYIKWVRDWTLDPKTVSTEYLHKAKQDQYNAYIRTHDDYVSTQVETFSDRSLAGAPIAIKDIFLTKWYITSCASLMLQDYVSPYSSTVFANLEQAGWLMIGKTNMDEFAMWWSNENSFYWPVKNPHDLSRVAGWSSGWSGAAVAGDLCLWALGTDTWWSVRMPAALCGVVWAKPTYGRASRYGIQAMSSSLDQAWTITKTVDDAVLLLDSICWYDAQDAMSQDRIWKSGDQSGWKDLHTDISTKKFAIPKQFLQWWLDDRIHDHFQIVVAGLQEAGATVEEIDLPILAYGVPTYYIICPAEVSTNMSRFDGIRYWLQWETQQYESIQKYYEHIRGKWFGDEVKRRIMIWSYVLSAWFYDAYYTKAVGVRAKMKQEIDKIYEEYDAIIGPTSPSVAWKIGEIVDDPVQNYLIDIYTVVANLCGLPAMSVPMWLASEWDAQLPTGFQIMCKQRDEKTMLEIGKVVENIVAG